MGYTTDFSGSLKFNKNVTLELQEYINRFSNTRRMPRDNEKIKEIYPNWKELCFFGELGNMGEYFAPHTHNYDDSIIDHNGFSVSVHPGLWCQWVIEGNELVWDGGEKFYNYIEWLHYLIDNFFDPLGYELTGDIMWEGEDSDDCGTIHVVNNFIEIKNGIHAYSMDDIDTSDLITELNKRGYKVTA